MPNKTLWLSIESQFKTDHDVECFAPSKIAERCFLSEAILWLLLREVPKLEYFSAEGGDDRFSDDREGEGGYYVDLTGLTDADCEKINISPNPAVELEDYGSDGVSFVTLDGLDWYGGKDERLVDLIYEEHSKEEIDEDRRLREMHSEWIEIVDSAMELPRAQILQAILQGELPAFCRNRIQYILEEDEDPEEVDLELDKWFVNREDPREFVEAPLHIFRATKIDWQHSSSTIGDLMFQDICVDTKALLQAFPDPNEHVITVVRVGDVLLSKDDDLPTPNRPQRGRPSLPWAEMHQELGRWIERDSIPNKKEALVAELMEWCRMKWGRAVSRSAIQSQLRNFGKDRK